MICMARYVPYFLPPSFPLFSCCFSLIPVGCAYVESKHLPFLSFSLLIRILVSVASSFLSFSPSFYTNAGVSLVWCVSLLLLLLREGHFWAPISSSCFLLLLLLLLLMS